MKFLILFLSSLLTIAFCNGTHHDNKNPYIDLTYALNNETVTWPGRVSTFNVEIEGFTPDGIWIASKGFCTSEHTATHIDAPYHFNPNGWTLDQIPLDNLLDIPAVMIDIYDKVHKFENGNLVVRENYAMTQEDIMEWERKFGVIPPNSLVLVRSGWGSRWPDTKLYRGEKDVAEKKYDGPATVSLDNNLNFPGFDSTAAKYLTVQRQVLGVGIDTISIDRGVSKKFLAHQIFANRNVFMLEMVANLHLLPPKGFKVHVVPFKIDKGTGAPTRVLAKKVDDY